MEKTKNDKINFKDFKLILHYLKNQKFKLTLYIILVFINFIPVLILPLIWGFTLESLINDGMNSFVLYLLLYSGILIITNIVLYNPQQKLYTVLENEFTKNVTKDLYNKIGKLPAVAFEKMGTGEFINRLSSDPQTILSLLNSLINLSLKVVGALFVIFVAFSVSVVLGLEVIIFSIIMGFLAGKFFPKIRDVQKNIQSKTDEYVKCATENISGIREIKALGIKENTEKNLFNSIDQIYEFSKKGNFNEINYYSFNNLLYFILQFVIILTCGYYFIQGNIAYSIFIMIEAYIWRIDDVAQNFSAFGVNFNKVSVSLGRLNDILENRLYQDEKFGDKVLPKETKGHIIIENVKFKYSEDENYTLNGLNLDIEPNKKIAIVGRSGNGKSTIFNLLLRYFDASSGKITIDGIELKELTEKSLRQNISIIRQTPFIFNMSIIDNFKLIKPNVTLKEVREVCKKAYIDEYIMSLKDGYDTLIGEGGVNLSGGQKQRMAIARTLLLNTKVILFDEATSALDNESQEYIKKTIDNLVKDHTVLIIAHRLSTIVDADEINVIKDGKLEGRGIHKTLIKNCDAYKRLYESENKN